MYPSTDDALIADFMDWLENQNPDQTYNYANNLDCCFCRYLRSRGYCSNPSVNPDAWRDRDDRDDGYTNYPSVIDEAVHAHSRYGDVLFTLKRLINA